ncbi:MAG: arginine--tRNA ligase [Oscillospiraceae bacterium]|nr:arginine--tRNA ligase [Oscillospiraceae bacterium]
MSTLVSETTVKIKQIIINAATKAMNDGSLPQAELPDFSVETPADHSHGDYAVNAAMVWARSFRSAPAKIAKIILDNADFEGSLIKSAEMAGPGFINMFLADEYFADILLDIEQKGEAYGRSNLGQGKKVMVEFVSANPTGPMHIGNARGGALGDCLAAVLDMAGYDVTREFYINDAGNQIQKFASSLEARYLQIFKPETEFPEDGYHGADIGVRAKEFADINGDSYVLADAEARRNALVDFALPLNIEGLRQDLATYRINYDVWFRESSLYESGALDKVLTKMKSDGLTYENDGAIWYKATEHGGEKDEVLVRANGNPTYFAADIAYHYNKFVIRGFDTVINVWGADHHGHVARLKGAMDAIGLDGNRLDIVLMQLVRLMQNGEMVKVSKRTGKSITLKTLLEEVPLDAARFIFNSKEPNTHLEFDLDLAAQQSSQNPVYYVQYAYARINSIIKNLNGEGIKKRSCTREELASLTAPEERELIRQLSSLTGEIVAAAKSYDSARITRYVFDLATLFHKFYNACRVKVEDEKLMQARLNLCSDTSTVIKNVLTMLKISAPESM